MALNLDGMEDQIKRAALSLLPAVANATLTRSLVTVRNDLGESALMPLRTIWPVRVYLLKYREARGGWNPGGIQERGRQEMLLASGGDAIQVAAWSRDFFWSRGFFGGRRMDLTPVSGDDVSRAGIDYKIVREERQDIGAIAYWLVEGERR